MASFLNDALNEDKRKAAKRREADPADPGNAQEPDWDSLGKKPSRPAGRRVGRPKGPERVPITVRILPHTNSLLTKAVEELEMNPQSIVEEALAAYFKRNKIQLDSADGQPSSAA
ncbi:hypothetical protein [Streptomyces sp. NRRL S-378]|uniref:hypothetical protein n=1 Tax=Streptomyces sp. NRRL S-378 TaxID=1463904 RepID=UPI0004CA2835|nr:hypothetical protein [Streptomyces sp. NRRL S-378]